MWSFSTIALIPLAFPCNALLESMDFLVEVIAAFAFAYVVRYELANPPPKPPTTCAAD